MPATLGPYNGGCFAFDCLRCGAFRISTEADEALKASPFDPRQVGTISGYIRANDGLTILEKDLQSLRRLSPPSVQKKATQLLLTLARDCPHPAMFITDPTARIIEGCKRFYGSESETSYPDGVVPDDARFLKWLAIAFANDVSELRWLIKDVLVNQSLIAFTAKHEHIGSHGYPWLIITPQGWAEVERLRSINPESATAFVAMSFREEFITLFTNGIAPGIAAAGFQAVRVDQKEHNNRIDDEIIATIRSSRFLVADFTIDRGGIYFEAGYALGLGLPVIWLVRDSEKDAIHFDNRQYNFIRWLPDNYPALHVSLKNRIEATIGRGPLVKNVV
jgi:hypothetical protein